MPLKLAVKANKFCCFTEFCKRLKRDICKMKTLELFVKKTSDDRPVNELKAVATMDDGTSLVTIYSKASSNKWSAGHVPDYKSGFKLSDEQVNDVKITLDDMVRVYVNGDPELGFNSFMPTSVDCKYVRELSLKENIQ